MVLSKLFSTSRFREKENEKKYIINGYPLTTLPVVPGVLKNQVKFKKVMRGSNENVGMALAHRGSDLVKPESLELIRKKILAWYHNDREFCKQFESEFPKNLVAISISNFNFVVGESCHEFKLNSRFKPSENSYFTYRKHSECVQCAYFNENGVEFMAGITFYPAPHGRPQLLKSNNALLYMANHSFIDYPLGDRHKSWFMVKCKHYGRFCSTAGKHVLLKCSKDDGVPRHYEYNHVTNKNEYNLCKECVEEFFTYKWEEPKKDTPVIPAIPVEEFVPAAVIATESEAPAVSRASSTESLIEGFDKVDVNIEDVESDIDAELID